MLTDSASHALSDDDQDGPPTRNNNTNLGRLPLGSPQFLGFQQQQPQFGFPFQQSGMGFPFNSAAFQQQNGFPQQSGFQQNSFQQQSGFPQNGFQQQTGFPQNSFAQNGLFQQAGNFPQQNGGLVGQGSQFNSIGLQNQLMGAQLGLGNQFGGSGIQNQQLALQNQLGLSQNPFALMGFLQQQQQQPNNQFGLQNQLSLKNQLGLQNQLGIQNPFLLQNQLGFQNQQLGQNPFIPFSQLAQQFGSTGLNNDPNSLQFAGLGNSQLGGFGLGQQSNNFGNTPQNNGGFGTGIGTGSSAFLGNNQLLIPGGQFQDSSSSSGSQFGSSANRFPFGTSSSSLNSNRFPGQSSISSGLGGSQFAGSQFSNQLISDPFMSQRPQLSSSFSLTPDNKRQQERPFRNSGNERALSFNDTFDSNANGFQQAQRQQSQQQSINPFLSQQPFASFNPQQPLTGNSLSAFDQQRPQLDSFALNQQQQQQQLGGSLFPSSFNQQFLQQQRQQQQQPSTFGGTSSFQNRPTQINNVPNGPFSNQGLGQNSSSKDVASDQASDQEQPGFNHFPQPQQPLPIPVTGFSCEGRPPGNCK